MYSHYIIISMIYKTQCNLSKPDPFRTRFFSWLKQDIIDRTLSYIICQNICLLFQYEVTHRLLASTNTGFRLTCIAVLSPRQGDKTADSSARVEACEGNTKELDISQETEQVEEETETIGSVGVIDRKSDKQKRKVKNKNLVLVTEEELNERLSKSNKKVQKTKQHSNDVKRLSKKKKMKRLETNGECKA